MSSTEIMPRSVHHHRVQFDGGMSAPGSPKSKALTAIARFAEAEGITIIAEFVEAETGKGSDALGRRPQLAAALATARFQEMQRAGVQAGCPATWRLSRA
jgi:hypothetical protein